MSKHYYFLVLFISIFTTQASAISSCAPIVITGNFSICLPGPNTTQLNGSGGSGIPHPTTPWTSSNIAVATINNTGLVTAVGFGVTTITYVDNAGNQVSQNLYVSAYPTISGNTSTCVAGTLQLNGSLFPNNAMPWQSSNTAIATVDNNGLVTGVSAGTCTITYMNLSGCTANQTVTIQPLLSPTVSCGTWANNAMTFNWNAVLGAVTYSVVYNINGGTFTFGAAGNILTYTVTNVQPTDQVVLFVTPSGPSGACYSGAFSCQSTPPCPEAGVLSGVQNICVGNTTSFTSTVAGGTWSSSDTTIASVNPTTGVITGNAAGTANMTYTVVGTGGCPNAVATRMVVVYAPASAGILSGNQNICIGNTTSFTSTVASGVWSSSNTFVASVNPATGVISGNAAGTATMTYTVLGTGGCSNAVATRTVTVVQCTALTLISEQPTLNQFVALNTPISHVAFRVGIGMTDVSVTGLPSGVTGTLNQDTYTLSGVPTVCGVFNYTVTVSGASDSGSISGVISVGTTTSAFCDTNSLPNSLAIDWAPVQGATNYEYAYSINGGPTQTGSTVASNYQVPGVQPGQSVLFTLNNAVGVACFLPVSVTCTLLANSDFDIDTTSVYPNPVQDLLYIKDLKFTSDISLFNAFGQEVYTAKAVSNSCNIPMSVLADGFYLVKITAQEQTKTIKVIKN